jgi:hypothetical protein
MRQYNKQLTTWVFAALACGAILLFGTDAMAQGNNVSFKELFDQNISDQIGAGGRFIKQASVILGIVMILGALARAYKFLRDGEASKKGVGELGYLLLAAAVGGVMWYAGATGESGVETIGLKKTVIEKETGGQVGW